MIEFIGWLGGVLLAICALPEFIKALKTKECTLTWGFLALWGFGEILALIYTLVKNQEVSLIPLIFNYGLNIFFISSFVYYKLRGKNA